MKRYTPDELNEVLRLHKLWAQDEEGGQRADLQNADLQGANLRGADLQGADLQGAYLQDADLRGADLQGADLWGANLRGADLWGANLRGADLQRADGEKMKIVSMRVFTGLYPYQCWAVVAEDGIPWVRMGCLWKSVEEWNRIGIRASNPGEFPDDGSEKCEERVRAFNYVHDEAVRMAEKSKTEVAA